MKTPQLPERLNAFQLRSCTRQRCLISPLLFSIVLAVLPSAIIEERDPYDPAILLLGIYLKKIINLKRYIHVNVYRSTIYNDQGMEANLSVYQQMNR